MRKLVIIALFLISVSGFAQDNPTPPPISAENFLNLQSVAHIDFDDFDSDFDSGWFALDNNGLRYALSDVTGRVYVVHEDGSIEFSFTVLDDGNAYPGSLVDADFGVHTILYTVHVIDNQVYLGSIQTELSGIPQSIWVNDTEMGGRFFIEILPVDTNIDAQILAFRINSMEAGFYLEDTFPYAPAQDTEAVVRIGRIRPPYAVTSSENGIVKLWNIETGTVLHTVDNGTGQAAVFGNINADATHLVWRDQDSNALYLLNFETGENRFVDNLDGAYVQWFFLSSDASVIIAINYDFAPDVVVWDVETGERTDLGEYRHCNRPQPDMARLSTDGTTLVTGCDTGLDIWRVVE